MSYQYPFHYEMKPITPFGEIYAWQAGLHTRLADGSVGAGTNALSIGGSELTKLVGLGANYDGENNQDRLRNTVQFNAYDYEYPHVVSNSHRTIRVWEVAPALLRADVIKGSLNGVTYAHAISAGYCWYDDFPLNRHPYSMSILVSEEKILANAVPHHVAAGCLIVHTDGSVEVKPVADISEEPNVQFAVGGMTICPELRDKAEGFSGDFAEALKAEARIMMGWQALQQKIIIAASKAMSAAAGRDLLLALGCSGGITLDSGGSALMQETGGFVLKSDGRAQFGCVWLDGQAR